MTRVGLLVLCVIAASSFTASACAAGGDWTGTWSLPAAADPVEISVQVSGSRATVAMGYGHPAHTSVAFSPSGGHVRFALPGLPANVVFAGVRRGRAIAGTVSQGAVRGTFRLTRGSSKLLPLFGLYRAADGSAVTVVRAHGFVPWLVELPSGRTHGIGRSGTVGLRLGDTTGNGAITTDANGITWQGTHYERVALRQREVRVGGNAATLTLPPGDGPFPAAVMVHGSGPQPREEFQTFTAYLALLGVAVLADDKRGVGQSTGSYPGERASVSTLDILARDTQAEARFAAKLPQVDQSRLGLFGDSQAGWTIALAAAREHAVRWAVPIVGPTVTVGETDLWGELAGKSVSAPSGTRPQMVAQVRAQGASDFDPRPQLAKLDIPMFWVYGDDDRNVPTELCVEALQKLKPGHDFSWVVLPMTHTPFLLGATGLLTSLPQSTGFAPGFLPAVGTWLHSRVRSAAPFRSR